ncbi:hypothetical protein [Nostoc sp.]|uniref:hypothetical protein n=1 Tax=Nostoc sp. TaxID=1180 RepID=UPI002FF2124A
MTDLALELSNPNNWNQVYDEARVATQKEGAIYSYIPIPVFEVPFLFTSHVLVVRCLCTIPTGKNWRWAGNLRYQFSAPVAGINSPTITATEISLRLNRTKLIKFPKIANNYQVSIGDAYWLTNLRITIWEYLPALENYTDNLILELGDDLTRIEGKIDALPH